MNTLKEDSQGGNKEYVINSLDGRIFLASLWVAGALSSLNGDTYRLHDPTTIKAALANTSGIAVTPELLTIMSIIFVVPIFMSALTLILNYSLSRRINRIIGIIYAVIVLGFFVLNFVLHSASYEFVWSTAQLIFSLLVVFYAWKQPGQKA
jgi:hypothetical protein